MLDEFERLTAAKIKVTKAYLHTVEKILAEEEDLEVPPPNGESSITPYFMNDFCRLQNIVSRMQSGNRSKNTEWTEYYDKTIAHHLGRMKEKFELNELNEDIVFNFDETHFIFDQDNCRDLGFLVSTNLNYAEVSNGTEGLTVGLFSRGGQNAKLESAFVIFKNQRGSYPIARVADDVQCVSYRSGKKRLDGPASFPRDVQGAEMYFNGQL